MKPLMIRLFGLLEVRRGSLLSFPTEKSRSLFSYLVVNRGRAHSRQRLMGTFWGECPEAVARKQLRTEIWRVRTVLEPRDDVDPGTYVDVHDDVVGFNGGSSYWLDLEEFETRIERVEPVSHDSFGPAEERLLQEAFELYRGDLLEGVYDEWCLFEQERVKLKLLWAIQALAQHCERQRRWRDAIRYAHRLLEHDPLRESIHRDMMRYHYHAGDRAAALRQFRACAQQLEAELDVPPMRETRELRDAILAEALPSPGPEGASPPPSPSSALQLLEAAAEDMDRARSNLRRGIAEVTRSRERPR